MKRWIRNLAQICAILSVGSFVGCAKPPKVVYVNLGRIRASGSSIVQLPALPAPPKALPAETFTLPDVPQRTLENSASPEVVRLQEDANEAQAQALKTVTKRLTRIYQKQIDLFAAEQQSLLADPDAVRVQQFLPQLYEAFHLYAESRLPLISRLAFLAGVPDNNPANLPPAANLRPVQKQRWEEANGLRAKIKVLDAEYDRKATEILAEAGRLANEDRLATLKKIDDFRRQMMERALDEAVNPLKSRKRPAVLRLEAAPEIVLPEQPSRSVNLPATDALSAPPQVEFEGSAASGQISKELLRRQLAIWAAINRFRVVQDPSGHVPDVTEDFERWRIQQKVGP